VAVAGNAPQADTRSVRVIHTTVGQYYFQLIQSVVKVSRCVISFFQGNYFSSCLNHSYLRYGVLKNATYFTHNETSSVSYRPVSVLKLNDDDYALKKLQITF